MNFLRSAVLGGLVLLVAPVLHALNLQGAFSATWAENLGRASGPADWHDAMRYQASGSASLFREWRTGFTTAGALDAGYEHVPRFTRLDALSGGISAQARQKFGFGPFAPAVVLDLGWHGRDGRVEGDGWMASAGLTLRKRLTDAWRLGLTGDWEQRYARSAVFDTRHHRAFATLSWDVTSRLQLSHGVGRLWGDFNPGASATSWSRALAGALGPDVAAYYRTIPDVETDTFAPGWVTYRVTGRVNFWWLELSPALGRDTSLPLRYESLFSINKVGVKYRQDVWSIQLLRRF